MKYIFVIPDHIHTPYLPLTHLTHLCRFRLFSPVPAPLHASVSGHFYHIILQASHPQHPLFVVPRNAGKIPQHPCKFSGMDILKACHLFSGTDAAVQYRTIIIFIIGFFLFFLFLKHPYTSLPAIFPAYSFICL